LRSARNDVTHSRRLTLCGWRSSNAFTASLSFHFKDKLPLIPSWEIAYRILAG
jgi:hypothetical protein